GVRRGTFREGHSEGDVQGRTFRGRRSEGTFRGGSSKEGVRFMVRCVAGKLTVHGTIAQYGPFRISSFMTVPSRRTLIPVAPQGHGAKGRAEGALPSARRFRSRQMPA